VDKHWLEAAASKKNADRKKFEVLHAVPATTSPKVIRGFRSVESASQGHGEGQAQAAALPGTELIKM